MTMAGSVAAPSRATAARAFVSASRTHIASAFSPGLGVSSTSTGSNSKGIPASERISARRGEAEARMSLIDIRLKYEAAKNAALRQKPENSEQCNPKGDDNRLKENYITQ
jgi:hypothetical protein